MCKQIIRLAPCKPLCWAGKGPFRYTQTLKKELLFAYYICLPLRQNMVWIYWLTPVKCRSTWLQVFFRKRANSIGNSGGYPLNLFIGGRQSQPNGRCQGLIDGRFWIVWGNDFWRKATVLIRSALRGNPVTDSILK